MTTDLARVDDARSIVVADPEETSAALTHWLGTGDLSKLTGPQRAALYKRTCDSLGINSLTRPFDWIEFYDPETKGKKLTLYPRAACADQLAYQHRIRVEVLEEKIVGSLFKVVVRGTMPGGRTEQNVAYLDLTDPREGGQLKGQRLGNAFMKAHTKAKRRLVFGMVGMMAPPEVEELQQVRTVYLDGRGNVLDHPTAEQKALADNPALARTIGEPTWEETAAKVDDILPDGGPDQRPRPEDLAPPEQPSGPRPTFKVSDEDVEHWQATWFAAVRGTGLDDDERRHAFIQAWTVDLAWPTEKQTNSLPTFLKRASKAEVEDLLGHVRAICDEERRSYLDDADADRQEAKARPDVDQRVHDAVQLTGGPAVADETQTAF